MNEEFQHVSKMMQEPLSDEPQLLISQLSDIEAWNSRMQSLLSDANTDLDLKSFETLPVKDANQTDFDRKIIHTSRISGSKMVRDKIEGLCEAIKTRITLGQSILKYYSTTQNISYPNQKDLLRNILEK